MLVELVKKSFKTVIDNPSITIYLVIYLIAFNLLIQFALSSLTPIISLILLICLFLLTASFLSGWGQVIKDSIDIENIKEKNFLSIFLEGVGKNILPVSLALLIYIIFFVGIITLASHIALKVFGSLEFILKNMALISQNDFNPMDFLSKLSDNQKYVLYGWQLTFMLSMSIYIFITMFYYPSVVFEEHKNQFLKPLKSIWTNLRFIFKHFLSIFLIYITANIIYILLSFLMGLSGNNFILGVLLLFIYIYFVSTFIMLIFNYYEAKNSSSDGSNGLRENEIINTTSKDS